jgi:AraC-like DNA-binding protein
MENNPRQEQKDFGFTFPFDCWDSMLVNFIYPVCWHDYYEIILVLEGKVTITIDGSVKRCSRGDIVSIDPGQMHGFPQSDPGTQLRFYHFGAQIFARNDNFQGLVGEGGKLFSRTPLLRAGDHTNRVLYTQVYDILDKIFTEFREKKLGFRFSVKAGLYMLVLAYLRINSKENRVRYSGKPVSLTTDRRMEHILLMIHKNFSNFDFDLDHAAREAAMSRFHFARFFKQQTGQTFHAYLTEIRLSYAKQILLQSNLPVVEIAVRCGFASLPTFYRIFKADRGCNPAVFRNQQKAINKITIAIIDKPPRKTTL